MNKITTRYGVLKGASHLQFYPDGRIKQCILSEANEIDTKYGTLIPQFSDDDPRRKRVKPVIYHENGTIKSLSLQNKTLIETKNGTFPAEMTTWYENGIIRRIFPLDGSITGFWSEEDEYNLAEVFEFKFPFATLKQKIVGIQFYEEGSLKNLTLWTKDRLIIQTPIGETEVRIGIEVYPDGTLKALEPAKPLLVETPIGKVNAYDPKAIGIHSDSLSLRFGKSGEIEAITTSMNKVTVVDKKGCKNIFKPQLKPSMFNLEAMELFPLKISFQDTKVCFNEDNDHVFDVKECSFTVDSVFSRSAGTCSSCDNCTACG